MGENRTANNIQSLINEHARELRDMSSVTQAAWNHYLETTDARYGVDAYEKLQQAEELSREAENVDYMAKKSDIEVVDDPQEITGLYVSPDGPYHALREIEYGMAKGENQEKVYLEPLEVALEDFRSFYMGLVGSPLYRDIERQRGIEEVLNDQSELQHNVYSAAEKLGFVGSELEEVINRGSPENMEAFIDRAEDLTSISFDYFISGLSILKEVERYRRQNDIHGHQNLVDSHENVSRPSQEPEPHVQNIITKPLDREMSEYIDLLTKLQKLKFSPDPLEMIDDSEIIDELEEKSIPEDIDSFWEEEI